MKYITIGSDPSKPIWRVEKISYNAPSTVLWSVHLPTKVLWFNTEKQATDAYDKWRKETLDR